MLKDILQETGLIAILRGIRPEESVAIAQMLYSAGIRIVEVPMNSPGALLSIRAIREVLSSDCAVGAGTVVNLNQVADVGRIGSEFVVMPHGDQAVIEAARSAGMEVIPGVATATEAFAALKTGVDLLKVFPVEPLGPSVLKAWLAVLPAGIGLVPVGGVTPENLQNYVQGGAVGFGVGSALYRPGMDAEAVGLHARQFVEAWRSAKGLSNCTRF